MNNPIMQTMPPSVPPPSVPPPNDLPIQNPLTIGELLDRSFRLYRKHLRVFLLTSAIFLLPYSLLSSWLLRSVMQNQFEMLGALFSPNRFNEQQFEQAAAQAAQSGTAQFGLIAVLVPLLGLLITMIVTLALTVLAVRALRGETPTLRMALEGVRRRFWAWFRLEILRYLAFLGLTLSVVILVALAAGISAVVFGGALSLLPDSFSDGSDTFAVIIFIAAASCLLLLLILLVLGPFAWVAARWAVAHPGIIDQGWGARQALRTSWRLTRGSALRIVLYLVLVWILYAIVVAMPLYLLQGISLIALGGDNLVLTTILSTLIGTLFNIFWQPLYAIFFVLLYFDMLLRSSGHDILERLERLESGLQNPAPSPAPYPAPYPDEGAPNDREATLR